MLLFIIGSYLLGAIPFGFLAGRAKGIDLRECGSRNIGATNAMRVLGKGLGSCVFICDFIKGFLPVFLWYKYGSTWMGLGVEASEWTGSIGLVLVSLAAILGHVYTCFLGFKGGKGVATAAGVLVAISPLMGAIALGTWAICLAIFRYVSLSSMIASVVMVIAGGYVLGFTEPGGWAWRPAWLVLLFLILVASLVIIKHRANIVRLIQGTEPKAFSSKKS